MHNDCLEYRCLVHKIHAIKAQCSYSTKRKSLDLAPFLQNLGGRKRIESEFNKLYKIV